MNEEIKLLIKNNYDKAINAKPFIDLFCDLELKRIYKEFETASEDNLLKLQSELKIIKSLQNKLNDTIIIQENINSYNNKLK